MVIICTNFVDLESSMLYTKVQPKSFHGSGEVDFLSVFTIYGHGSHLVKWCRTIQTNHQYPFDRRPHLKSGENCLSDF